MFITTADMDHAIIVEGECPDPSTESGFAPAVQLGETARIVPDFALYRYVRWTGITRKTSYDPAREFFTSVTTNFLDKQGNQWSAELKAPRINGLCMYSLGNVYTFQGGCASYICGPCEENAPWRSGVWAVSKPFVTIGGTPRIGGLRTNSACSSSPPQPFMVVGQFNPGDPAAREFYVIDGVWQFSNDGSTIEVEWAGSGIGSSIIPNGADPGSPTYTCS